MKVTIYHNPDCGTSRNVLGLIRNTGEEPVIIEYLKTPPTRGELKELIARMHMPVRNVLRQKGTPYDALGLSDPKLSNDQLLDAMMAHPILINRPIVVTLRGVKLCRPSEAVLDILEAPQRGGFTKKDGEKVLGPDGNSILRPAP
jgi:arsenate reductase